MINNKGAYIFVMLVIVCLTIIVFNIAPASSTSLKIMGVIGFFQLTYSILSWSKLTSIVYTPYVVFLVAAYVFTFGQSFLYVFDLVTPKRDLTLTYTFCQVYDAQVLTLIFLNFFHIGALLSLKKRFTSRLQHSIPDIFQNKYVNNQVVGIRLVGTIFIAISIIPYIIDCFTSIMIVQAFGYGGIYEQTAKIGVTNIISILSDYFIPGVLCLLIIEQRTKYRLLYIGALLFDIIFCMYIGGRSNGVILATILLLYYHNCVKPIKFKQFATFAVIGYLFISFLSAVGETRADTASSAVEVFVDNFGKNDAFFEAISEMGGSMMPMITSLEIVPEIEDYKYGSSYLYSLTSVIPNMGFWDLHPAMKYGNLNQWLQDRLDLSYGPGFSIVAEAYVNFGNLGFLFMLVLGYLFGMIFKIDIKSVKNPVLIVLSIVLCYLIIKTVRNSFLATVRSLFYYILPIYYIVIVVKKGKLIK